MYQLVSIGCLPGRSPSDSFLIHSLNRLIQSLIVSRYKTIGIIILSHVFNKVGKNRMLSFLVRGCTCYHPEINLDLIRFKKVGCPRFSVEPSALIPYVT